MGEQDTTQFDDLLQPLRSLGWTATIEDDGGLHLRHPLEDMILFADSPDEMRRMLSTQFAPDSALMEALRQAPRRTEDLAVVGDLINVCRAFSSDPRLPSAVLGVMADKGFVEDETYEWLRSHAEAVVHWGLH